MPDRYPRRLLPEEEEGVYIRPITSGRSDQDITLREGTLPRRAGPELAPPPSPPRVESPFTALGTLTGLTSAPAGAAFGSLLDRPGDVPSAGRAAWETLKRVPETMFQTSAQQAESLTTPSKEARKRTGVDTPWGADTMLDLSLDPANLVGGDAVTDIGKLGVMGASAALSRKNINQMLKLPEHVRGMWSRVDELFKKLVETKQIGKKGIDPQRLANLLKQGTNPEELAVRKVNEFLAAKGKTPITVEELGAHLEANPAPYPRVHRLQDTESQVIPTYEDARARWLQAEPDLREEEIGERYNQLRETLVTPRTTSWKSYTEKGGEGYHETLFQHAGDPETRGLQDQINAINEQAQPLEDIDYYNRSAEQSEQLRVLVNQRNALEAQMPRQFSESTHFPNDKDLYGFTRAKYRNLTPEGLRPVAEIEQQVFKASGLNEARFVKSEDIARAVEGGHITPEEGQQYGWSRKLPGYETPPKGARGVFTEEHQSDLHQQGDLHGYGDNEPRRAELQAEVERLRERRDLLYSEKEAAYESAYPYSNSYDEPVPSDEELAPARAHYDDLVARYDAADNDLDEAYRTLNNLGTPPPDRPFKDSWQDLQFSRNLLAAAADPTVDWVGYTSGRAQARRNQKLHSAAKLVYDTTKIDPLTGKRGVLTAFDHYGSPVYFPASKKRPGMNPAYAVAHLERPVAFDRLQTEIGPEDAAKLRAIPPDENGVITLTGDNLYVGGRDMYTQYDDKNLTRFNKILGRSGIPGAQFQRTELPFHTPGGTVYTQQYHVVDNNYGRNGQFPTEAAAQEWLDEQRALRDQAIENGEEWTGPDLGAGAYISSRQVDPRPGPVTEARAPHWAARMTPELRAWLNKHGLYLMGLMGAAAHLDQLTSQPGQPGQTVGTPPPLPPIAGPLRDSPP